MRDVARVPPLREKKKQPQKSISVRLDAEHRKMLERARVYYMWLQGKGEVTITDVILAAIEMMYEDVKKEYENKPSGGLPDEDGPL